MKQVIKALSAIAGSAVATGPVLAQDAPVFDVGVEITGVTDYMDSGLTNSDHNPSGGITISPSYGLF